MIQDAAQERRALAPAEVARLVVCFFARSIYTPDTVLREVEASPALD